MRRTSSVLLGALCTAVLVGSPSPASADGEQEDDDVQHDLSLTFSPVHLLVPFFEVTGEYRFDDKLAAALVVGGGKSGLVGLYEIGAQFRYYLVGSFIHGMQLGFEVLFAGGGSSLGGFTASATGIQASPFIGYKIAANVGFTFELQAGGGILAVTGTSDGQSESEVKPGLMLNINLGWSFDL